MTTGKKPDIYLSHMPSRNGGDAMRIKTLSWKLKFGCRIALYKSFR
jgi:hypothetical protein